MSKKPILFFTIIVIFISLAIVIPVEGQDTGGPRYSDDFNYTQNHNTTNDLVFRNYSQRTSLEILSDIITDDPSNYGNTYDIVHPFPWAETSLYSNSINLRNTENRYWDLLDTYFEYHDLNNPACIREEFYTITDDDSRTVYSNVYKDLYYLSNQNFTSFDNTEVMEAMPLEKTSNNEVRVPTDLILGQDGAAQVIINETSISNEAEIEDQATSQGYIQTDLETASKVLFYGLDEERLSKHLYLNYRLGFEGKQRLLDSTREKYYSQQHFENVEKWNSQTRNTFNDLVADYKIEVEVFNLFGGGGNTSDTNVTRNCHTQVNSESSSGDSGGGLLGGFFDGIFSTVQKNPEQYQVSFHGPNPNKINAYGGSISNIREKVENQEIDPSDGWGFTGDYCCFPGIANGPSDTTTHEDLRDAHITTVNLDNSTRVGQYIENKNNPPLGRSTHNGYTPPLRISNQTDYNAFVDWTAQNKQPGSYGSCPTGSELTFTGYQGSEIINTELIAVHDGGEDVIQNINTAHGLVSFENIGDNVSGNFSGLPEGTEELRVESNIMSKWSYIYEEWYPLRGCVIEGSGIYYEFATPQDSTTVDVERMPNDKVLPKNETMNASLDLMIDAYPEGTFYKVSMEPGKYDNYGYWTHLSSQGVNDTVLARGPWGLTVARKPLWDVTFVSFSQRGMNEYDVNETIVEDLNRIAPVEHYAFPDVRNYQERQLGLESVQSFSQESNNTTTIKPYQCGDLSSFNNCEWNFRYSYDADSYLETSNELGTTPSFSESIVISGYTNQDISEREGVTLHRLVNGNNIKLQPDKYEEQTQLSINVTRVEKVAGVWKVDFRLENSNGNLAGGMNLDRPGESLTISGSHSAAREVINSYNGTNPYTITLDSGNWDTSLYIEFNYEVDIGTLLKSGEDIEDIYYVYNTRHYHFGSLLPSLRTLLVILLLWFVFEKAYTYLLLARGWTKYEAKEEKLIPVFKYIQIPKPAFKWRKALQFIKMISFTFWASKLGIGGKGKGQIKGPSTVQAGEIVNYEFTTEKDKKGRKYLWSIQTNPSRPTAEKTSPTIEHSWEKPGTYEISAVMKKDSSHIKARKKVKVIGEGDTENE